MSPGTLSVWDWAGHQKCVRVVFINSQWWLKLKTAHFTGAFEMSQLCLDVLSVSHRPDPWLSKKQALLSNPHYFSVHRQKSRFIQNHSLFQKSLQLLLPSVSFWSRIDSWSSIVLSFFKTAPEEKEKGKHIPKYDILICSLILQNAVWLRGEFFWTWWSTKTFKR